MKNKRPYIDVIDTYDDDGSTIVVGVVKNGDIYDEALVTICTLLHDDLGIISHINGISVDYMMQDKAIVGSKGIFRIEGVSSQILRPGMIVEVIG